MNPKEDGYYVIGKHKRKSKPQNCTILEKITQTILHALRNFVAYHTSHTTYKSNYKNAKKHNIKHFECL